MRILVISNFYPPHIIGGYEIGCRDIVEALRSRGHEVSVLTSTYGVNCPEQTGQVYRWLETDLSFKIAGDSADLPKIIRKESINRRAFNRLCQAFSPDIVGEIEKLKAAEGVILVTPLWWSSVPAILKGWLDRVLAMGVAWDSGRIYQNGLLRVVHYFGLGGGVDAPGWRGGLPGTPGMPAGGAEPK